MSRTEEMRSLTENLMRSHQERIAELVPRQREVGSSLRETRDMIAEQHATRVDSSVILWRNLAEDRTARHSAVCNMLDGLGRSRARMAAAETADRRVEVQGLCANTQCTMQEFHSTRVAGEAALKDALRRGRFDLFQGVSNQMDAINQAQAEMAAEQRHVLAQGRSQLTAETATFLGQTHAARSAMADAQHEMLEVGRAALQAHVSATIGGFHAERTALAGNLAEFSQIWRDFSIAKHSVPTGVASAPPLPKVEVKDSPPTVPIAPVSAAEVHAAPSVEEIFSYLADRPDGVRLTELEEHFGTPRIRLAGIVARMIEANKVRKDESLKLYFAA